MAYLTQIRNAFINRQYRMTFRAVLTGLLANDWAVSQPDDEVIQKAHELTVLSLQQFRKTEV